MTILLLILVVVCLVVMLFSAYGESEFPGTNPLIWYLSGQPPSRASLLF